MRIESVTAHAFGPLAGETLELAPGLTVVAGVNESAKSSWHAALYAALCGRGKRRAATPADRRLVERYKPWNDAPWLLSALLVLDDGRRLEICQDLDGVDRDGVDRSRVTELGEDGTSTDVGAEIHATGTPDASRWLGPGPGRVRRGRAGQPGRAPGRAATWPTGCSSTCAGPPRPRATAGRSSPR